MEADRRGALHNRVKEDLNTKVVSDIKQWQKDTFHKVREGVKWWIDTSAGLLQIDQVGEGILHTLRV